MGTQEQQDFWIMERTGALDAKLDPKLTAQRQAFGAGQGGRKLTYLEGHAAIAQLNRLFGYGGWSYSVDEMGVDEYTQGPPEGWYAGFFAVVTLRVGGVSRQDVGCVEVQNTGKGGSVRDNVHNVDSRSTARKGAVTDALKRAARTFGQQLGNGLYDVDDDVYAWMTAHSLDEGEVGAPAPATKPAAAGARAASPTVTAPVPQPAVDPHAALRAEVADALTVDTEAASKLPKGADTMTGQELEKTRTWLLQRAAEARTAAQQDEDEHAALRAEVVALLAEDGPALALLQQQGKPLPPEQDAATLAKTKTWLLQRKKQQRPLTPRLLETIARAGTEEEVKRAVADAWRGQEKKDVSVDEYRQLCQAAEARKAELSAPLLAGGQGRARVAS